jgi:DNA-directed RNA polymerase beta' subunit
VGDTGCVPESEPVTSAHHLVFDALGAGDVELKHLELGFASADAICARAPKQVTRAETLDFKTLTPERDGLFDHRVFGPGTVIDAALPASDEAIKPPKTQFARVTLARPIVHPLVCAHAPQELAKRAGTSFDDLERWKRGEDPVAYANLIAGLELNGDGNLVMREMPVLPPDLRPLRRLADDRWAVSPLNDFYRRVLYRNVRLAQLVEQSAPEVILVAETRQLHDSVLHLFDSDTALPELVGGRSGLSDALRALDERDLAAAPTGRSYRIEAVLFALGIVIQRRA